jgi:hypothetical protein
LSHLGLKVSNCRKQACSTPLLMSLVFEQLEKYLAMRHVLVVQARSSSVAMEALLNFR